MRVNPLCSQGEGAEARLVGAEDLRSDGSGAAGRQARGAARGGDSARDERYLSDDLRCPISLEVMVDPNPNPGPNPNPNPSPSPNPNPNPDPNPSPSPSPNPSPSPSQVMVDPVICADA